MGIKVNGIQIAGIGAPGKSAYDYAKEGGYPGTENEFKQLIERQIIIENTLVEIPSDSHKIAERIKISLETIGYRIENYFYQGV